MVVMLGTGGACQSVEPARGGPVFGYRTAGPWLLCGQGQAGEPTDRASFTALGLGAQRTTIAPASASTVTGASVMTGLRHRLRGVRRRRDHEDHHRLQHGPPRRHGRRRMTPCV